jgi:hypothetical protein
MVKTSLRLLDVLRVGSTSEMVKLRSWTSSTVGWVRWSPLTILTTVFGKEYRVE